MITTPRLQGALRHTDSVPVAVTGYDDDGIESLKGLGLIFRKLGHRKVNTYVGDLSPSGVKMLAESELAGTIDLNPAGPPREH